VCRHCGQPVPHSEVFARIHRCTYYPLHFASMLVLRLMLLMLALIAAINVTTASSHTESWEASSNSTGSSLLQAKRKREWFQQASFSSIGSSAVVDGKAGQQEVPGVAPAKRIKLLPPHLYELGLQLFQTEQALDDLVTNTVVQSVVYAGVPMKVCTLAGDGVDANDFYGIATLGESLASAGKALNDGSMLSMIDIGANYGRISLATFRYFPQNIRIVAVEPMPWTYFLLKWNLWLNGVPELALDDIYANPSKPGVLTLNHGIENVDEKVTGFCYTPPHTTTSRICNCSHGWTKTPEEQCVNVVSKSLDTLVSMFGVKEITFLKIDCEGCELDVIPSLINLQATTGLQVHRLAGELHAMPNELEDYACQAEEGKFFVSTCFLQNVGHTLPTQDRCKQGPARESCSRISYAELRDKRPPPSEW